MKELTLEEMKEVNGGAWYHDVDAACAGIGAGAALATMLAISVPPLGVGVSVGCAVWGIYRAIF